MGTAVGRTTLGTKLKPKEQLDPQPLSGSALRLVYSHFFTDTLGCRTRKKRYKMFELCHSGKDFFANEKFINSVPLSHAGFAQNIECLLKINAYSLMFTTLFTAVPANKPAAVTSR